jgi:homoserine dehydrogenase
VGSAVVRQLSELPSACTPTVQAVAVRDIGKPRNCVLAPGVRTDDVWAVVEDPRVDIVIEAMGGLTPATELTARALELGKPVVTANKAVLGEHGPQLRSLARARGIPLLFEAAVAGAVPIVRGLSGLSRADEIIKIEGVLNGTSTFVLSHVEATGCTPEEAVAEAQRLGFAEADAARDLDGTDAADKLAVLVQYLFDEPLHTADVHRLGIDVLTRDDIVRTDGRRWRLVATAVKGTCARVEPVALRHDHPLAAVSGPHNAIAVTGRRCGTITLSGAGAGGDATACSVVADLLAAQDWLAAIHPAACATDFLSSATGSR